MNAIKDIAPELPKFSRIHAVCDVTDWLMQAVQVDKSQYILYATGRLEGLPLQYCNTCKSQAREHGMLTDV